ncbi:hypothetical protein EDC01DRAFT_634564 [Geopyxis carbonaria]|nr:hypothetical protein EDC01DRAFT_634564 [Geopyxis carbonaria]
MTEAIIAAGQETYSSTRSTVVFKSTSTNSEKGVFDTEIQEQPETTNPHAPGDLQMRQRRHRRKRPRGEVRREREARLLAAGKRVDGTVGQPMSTNAAFNTDNSNPKPSPSLLTGEEMENLIADRAHARNQERLAAVDAGSPLYSRHELKAWEIHRRARAVLLARLHETNDDARIKLQAELDFVEKTWKDKREMAVAKKREVNRNQEIVMGLMQRYWPGETERPGEIGANGRADADADMKADQE